jgi:hypothetical protein
MLAEYLALGEIGQEYISGQRVISPGAFYVGNFQELRNSEVHRIALIRSLWARRLCQPYLRLLAHRSGESHLAGTLANPLQLDITCSRAHHPRALSTCICRPLSMVFRTRPFYACRRIEQGSLAGSALLGTEPILRVRASMRQRKRISARGERRKPEPDG